MIKIKYKNVFVFILLLLVCYLFFVTIYSYFNAQVPFDVFGLASNRGTFMFLLLVFGCIIASVYGKFSLNRPLLFGMFLVVYMFLRGFTLTNTIAWISIAIMWWFFIFIFYSIRVDADLFYKICVFLSVFSIILSLLYIVEHHSKPIIYVAQINCIYYIIALLPFIERIDKPILSVISIFLLSFATLLSGKTGCFIVIIVYFIYKIGRVLKERKKNSFFHLGIISLIVVFGMLLLETYFSGFTLSELFNKHISELMTGGNGRNSIYLTIIKQLAQSSIPELIFGHGYYTVNNIGMGSHNDFLMMLFDYGIIGFSLYICFCVFLIKARRSIEDRRIRQCFVVSLLVFFVLSFISNLIYSQMQMIFICIFWGVSLNRKDTSIQNASK